MTEPWEWAYQCCYCETRFSSHPELAQHMIDEHGFKRTKNSHTARYWRHFYNPLSDAERKLKAVYDAYKRLRQQQVVSPFLKELDEILEGEK